MNISHVRRTTETFLGRTTPKMTILKGILITPSLSLLTLQHS